MFLLSVLIFRLMNSGLNFCLHCSDLISIRHLLLAQSKKQASCFGVSKFRKKELRLVRSNVVFLFLS